MQKAAVFLYISNNLKMKLIILFMTASKRIKYLGINLTKEVKDLYLENYKTLRKEMNNKWEDTLCS